MKTASIRRFISAIERLPSDKPHNDDSVWYSTQKDHWLGWLRAYHTEGAYGRTLSSRRDACFAYNHIINWQMLEWLIEAAGVDRKLVAAAKTAAVAPKLMQQKAAAIRRVAPWSVVAAALWPNDATSVSRR